MQQKLQKEFKRITLRSGKYLCMYVYVFNLLKNTS